MDGAREAVVSSRYINLRRSFELSIRSLLTAFSEEDVSRAFPSINECERRKLFCIFVQAIKSLHENVEDEFKSICQESKASDVLCTIEQLLEEQKLDILSAKTSNIMDAKAKLSMAKKDELEYLRSLLEKLRSWNSNLGDFSST